MEVATQRTEDEKSNQDKVDEEVSHFLYNEHVGYNV